MKVTLQVNGREMTFSEEELITIVEKHLLTETNKKATMKEVARKPTEDKYFEVKPWSIDQNLFARKRNNIMQNEMRQLIVEAFAEMEKHPEKYGKNFKTMMPKKTWDKRSVKQLKEIASEKGDHNADWVEQALEWAQRISNGESWKSICNTADTVVGIEWLYGRMESIFVRLVARPIATLIFQRRMLATTIIATIM